MKIEIKDFIKSDDMVLVLDRDNKGDVVSYWKSVRCSLVAPFNYVIIQLMKISPFMGLTRFCFRNFLGMKIAKNTGFAQVKVDPLFPDLISVGENSSIGWGSRLLCHGFTQKNAKIGKIVIGKNVLIGADSLIGPGVRMGDNSVVAMKSLVIKDVPANELWGGVPAKKIKELKELI